ncbi:recombinase family protein [Nocardia sp. NPDC055165]
MLASIPQSHSRFAVIYCRISSDKTGKAAGVERQEADCRALAERLGLTVIDVLVDNDISAYSGKPRPGYEKLLGLMKDGGIGTVLAYHQDRLQRSPVELETYVDISDAGKVTTHTVLSGHHDLSTPSGRFQARIIGAAARYEVEHMIERQRDAKLDAAKAGEYLGGQRPYGFEPKRVALRESEAEVIREIARSLIKGASFNSLAIDLNKRAIPTQHGNQWNAANVRNLMIRPINAGIVHHKGIDYKATSPAILTPEEWGSMMAIIKMNAAKSPHPGRFRKYMLNRLIFCGACGGPMYHKPKQQRDGSYKPTTSCGKSDPHTGKFVGCGGVSRMVEPIEVLVTDAVIYRLSSPEFAAMINAEQTEASSLDDLRGRQVQLEASIAEATTDYYKNKLLSREEFQQIKRQLDDELAAVTKETSSQYSRRLNVDIDLSGDIRAAWEDLEVSQRRELLMTLISKIYVDPRPKVEGYTYPKYKDKYRFDPELIRIEWAA